MTNQITISSISIRQDSEGRYSLNDLHKAAGGESRHAPAQWLRLEQVNELILAILNMQICTFKPVDSYKGRYGGTYVCRELVFAYATWINPEFYLKVIRAYDALVSGDIEKAVAITKTTVDDRTPLRSLVNRIMGKYGIPYQPIYKMIHREFGVNHIDELSPKQAAEAMDYLASKVIEGEFLGKQESLSAPKLDINFPISWFEDNAPYAVTSHPDCHKVHLDYYSLREMVSPSYLVMKELTKQGYDVSAAVAEMKALRHVMIEQAWALKEISKYTGIREKAAVRIEL